MRKSAKVCPQKICGLFRIFEDFLIVSAKIFADSFMSAKIFEKFIKN